MKGLAALVLLLASSFAYAGDCSKALPNGDAPICSQTFTFAGTCRAQPSGDYADMVYNWQVTPQGQWNLKPWLPYAVYFVGAEIVDVTPGDAHVYYMLGNNAQGDAMLYLHSSEWHGRVFYPEGTSWRFPASSEATATDYLDIHGACKAGMWANLQLTLYFKPEILPLAPAPATSTAVK